MSVIRLTTLWRVAGPGYVLRFLARRFMRVSRHVVYEAWIDDVAAPGWPEGTTVVTVSEEVEAADIPTIQDNLRSRNIQYLEGIRDGDAVGVFVLEGDALIHWGFLMRGSRTSALLGEGRDEILLGNAFTHPAYRGRGLQTCSLRQRLYECQSLGYDRALAETEPDNWASRRAMERVGFTLVREVTLIVLLNRLVFRRTWAGRSVRTFGFC